MQGQWKNKVSGWKKDCKRRKQSKKHFLKDKRRFLKQALNDKNHRPGVTEDVYKEVEYGSFGKRKDVANGKKIEYTVTVYQVEITGHEKGSGYFDCTERQYTKAFFKDGKWHEIEGNVIQQMKNKHHHINITTCFEGNSFHQKKLYEIENPQLEQDIAYNNEIVEARCWGGMGSKTYFYKQDVTNRFPQLHRHGKKWSRGMRHRHDRREVRDWINSGDFESVVHKKYSAFHRVYY